MAVADKMATLQTEDGVVVVDVRLLKISGLLQSALSDVVPDGVDDDLTIPVAGIKTNVMNKVVDFLKLYTQEPMKTIETPVKETALDNVVQGQYVDYIDHLGYEMVFEVVKAANYLGIEPLVSLALAWIAFILKKPSFAEFKKLVTIENDLTSEEEAIFRQQFLLSRGQQFPADKRV